MARKLFKEINTTEPHPQKYSVLGSQMGINADFNSYIQGYINAAKIVYERYKMADAAEIDVLDTLVYPICFLYRQITELYIKHIYIKYSTEDENGKSDFVKRVSHKLELAWEKTTPILKKLKERFPSFSVSIEECGELIKQIDEFDTTSMRMRYPITKDFRATNEKPMLLDIDNLNEGMNELFEKLQKICDFFSNVLADNTVDSAFEIKVLEKAPSCSNIMIDMAKKIEEVQAQESVLPKKRDTDIPGLLNLGIPLIIAPKPAVSSSTTQSFEKKRNSSALFAREINLVTQPSFDCEQGINSQVQTACSNADAVFPVLGIVFCKNERFSLSRKTHVPLWNEPRISHVRLL